MENRVFFKKPSHVFLLAMLCCILWGSAAPFIKWGYQLFNIEGVPSILMFAGIRFALAGLLVILFGSFLQKKVLVAKKENIQGKDISQKQSKSESDNTIVSTSSSNVKEKEEEKDIPLNNLEEEIGEPIKDKN